MSESNLTTESGRELRLGRIALAAVLLTGFFMVIRFPYAALAERVVDRVSEQTGARITLGPVSLGVVRWLPGIAAREVGVRTPNGVQIDLARLGLRPALSPAWLLGRPVWSVEVESAQGAASGVARLDDTPGFDGRVEQLDLSLLPLRGLGPGLRLEGRADADLDLAFGETGPEGHLEFEAHEGMVSHASMPLPMAYQRLAGDVEIGGDVFAQVRELTLDSPLATGRATGRIGKAASFAAAPLDLEIALTVSGPVRSSLNAQGVQLGNAGEVTLQITGTVSRPVVR